MSVAVAPGAPTQTGAPGRRRLWAQVAALVRPWRRLLALVVVCVIGAALAAVVPPLVIRHVVDHNLLPRRSTGLVLASLAYLGAVTAAVGFGYAYSYASAVVAQRAIAPLRVRLFAHVARLPVSYLDRTPLGDIVSRATADVETIDTLFTDGIATLIGQLASLTAVAVAMVAISPLLSAVSVLVVPPLAAASRWLQVRVRDAERRTRVAVGGLNTQLSETVGGAETIRAFGRQASFVDRFRRALVETLVSQERSVRYNALFTPVTSLLSASAIGALLWVGAGGVLGSLGVDLGTLIAFVLLLQGFFTPIVALGDQWNSVQAAIAGAERVFEVLDLPAEPPPQQHEPVADSAAAVVVSRVRFGYEKDHPVLLDVDLAVRPGEQVAVVGRTGAGKSTLLALIGGLYEPGAGEILLAGRHPRSLRNEERRRILGVVPQNVQLFSGSLRDNLTLGDEAIQADAIDQVISLVGLGPVVAGLADGLDTSLAPPGGGDGVVLSAGQRQLVALARALVAEPTVLLLDEATAAIDARSDAAFRAALARAAWAQHCAVVTVAHRISTARRADRVLVLESGRIVEEGAPDELMAAGGFFAALAAIEDAGWDDAGQPTHRGASATAPDVDPASPDTYRKEP
ncbi:MAG: ABC transporter ATP-binding protein [Acidimicrobiales bacterium]